MDYEDYKSGYTSDNCFIRAKNDMIRTLLSKSGSKKRILCVGAGTGEDLKILKTHGNVHVIDINKKALAMIPDRLCTEKKLQDVCKLSYPDGFFDIAVSFDVFEHIKNDHQAVSEIHRVLKTGGQLIFSVPAIQSLFSSHDRALGHMRRYSKSRLKKLFASYRDLELLYWNSVFFLPIAAVKMSRRKSNPGVDRAIFPGSVNKIIFKILRAENIIFGYGMKFPFGISIVGRCKK